MSSAPNSSESKDAKVLGPAGAGQAPVPAAAGLVPDRAAVHLLEVDEQGLLQARVPGDRVLCDQRLDVVGLRPGVAVGELVGEGLGRGRGRSRRGSGLRSTCGRGNRR